MSNKNSPVDISELRKQYLYHLPTRIEQLKNKFQDASGECVCELFARVKRVLDIARLLKIPELMCLQAQFERAEDAYKIAKDLALLYSLIEDLNEISTSTSIAGTIALDVEQLKSNINQKHENKIHILAEKEKANYIIKTLEGYNYNVGFVSGLQALYNQINPYKNNIVIVDEASLNEDINAIDYFSEIKKSLNTYIDFILLTNKPSLEKKLHALRNNTRLVFNTHDCCSKVIHAIEQIAFQNNSATYHVLIIANDSVISDYFYKILVAIGIKVTVVNVINNQLFSCISVQKFNLIIIDYFLDDMYGYEIYQLIKQEDYFIYTPTMFLYSDIEIGCNVHPELMDGHGLIFDLYETENFINKVFQSMRYAFDAQQLGQSMAGAIRESENRRIALDAHCIVSVADISGNIVDVNEKFCQISGYSREELIGINHRIVNSGYHSKKFFIDMWETIASGKIWQGEICNKSKNGSLYWVESTIVPFLDENSRPYQYVSMRTDVTRIKETENNLRISENRLVRSQTFANIGTWDWNIQSGELYWTPKIGPLFGYEEGALETSYENFLNAVHESDRQNVTDAVNNCIEHNEEYEVEHRCVWPDGQIRWMLEKGDVVRDEAGKPLHMLGVVQDITDRKNAEIEVEKQKTLLAFLKDSLSLFMQEGVFSNVAESILSNLVDLTDSEYGFVGEILYDDKGIFIRSHAIVNKSWNNEEKTYFEKQYKDGLRLRESDNLFGLILKNKKEIICNDVLKKYDDGGIPKGHPTIKSYMGVPVFYNNSIIGVYVLANKKDGYLQRDLDFLKPFNATYSSIIRAKHVADLQNDTMQQLKLSKQEAEEANSAKSKFLANMSHELRTPMNAILGFGQLLEMNLEETLSKNQQDSVKEILKAGHHLLELINDVLDLSKIESGNINLNIESLLLAPMIFESVSIIEPDASKRNLLIEYYLNDQKCDFSTIENENIQIYADHVRIKQVLLNLLSNAVKYNKHGGVLRIKVNKEKKEVVYIHVEDTGKGISKKKQTKLFQSFNRLGAEASEIEGTGIGLVITKQIVEMMGGNIGFNSRFNVGSDFWVSFLISANNKQTDLQKNTSPVCISSDDYKKVVYIEDNRANMHLLVKLFSSLKNIKLYTAYDSCHGLELIDKYQPDMILLDINLPDISGYELVERIRQNRATHNTPVIAISANAMSEDIEKAFRAGFNEYLTKPIDISKLFNVMSGYLN